MSGVVCPGCGRQLVAPKPGSPVLRATLAGHHGPVHAAAFSFDGRLLATTGVGANSERGKQRTAETIVWDLAAGEPLFTRQWHRDAVLCAAFSPRSEILVTGSQDHSVAVWDVSRGIWDVVMGLLEQTLRGHKGAVTSSVFSPDGAWLVTGGDDQTIRFWDTQTWQSAGTISVARKGACRLAFSPCGRYLAAIWHSRGAAVVWDAVTRDEVVQLRLRSDEDFDDLDVAFSHDGTRLAVLSSDEGRIWDISTCQVLTSFAAGGMQCLSCNPSRNLLATGGWDLRDRVGVRIRDWETAALLHDVSGHNQPVSAIAFSHDGNYLASASRDAEVRVWELPVKQEPSPLSATAGH